MFVRLGDQHDMVDNAAEEARARIAGHVDRGDDHEIEALGLIESAADIGVVNASLAAALRRHEGGQIDIGLAIARDDVGEEPASRRDIDKPGFALFGVERRQRAALDIGVDQKHALAFGGERRKRERDGRRIVLGVERDDQNARIVVPIIARLQRVVDFVDAFGERRFRIVDRVQSERHIDRRQNREHRNL